MLAYCPAEYWVPAFQSIEYRMQRRRPFNFDCYISFDSGERPQMKWEYDLNQEGALSGRTFRHRDCSIYYEVHGAGPRVLFFNGSGLTLDSSA